MKSKTFFIFLVMAFFILVISNPAMAGIKEIITGAFESTTDWILGHALSSIMTMVFLLIGAFWGGTSWGKLLLKGKAPLSELDDVVVKIYNARKANSPGGKTITSEEWEEIMKEIQDVVEKTIESFGGTPATKTT